MILLYLYLYLCTWKCSAYACEVTDLYIQLWLFNLACFFFFSLHFIYDFAMAQGAPSRAALRCSIYTAASRRSARAVIGCRSCAVRSGTGWYVGGGASSKKPRSSSRRTRRERRRRNKFRYLAKLLGVARPRSTARASAVPGCQIESSVKFVSEPVTRVCWFIILNNPNLRP